MVRRAKSLFGAVAVISFMAACSQTDPGVTTAVKAKLAADDTVKAYKIDVDTKNGIVTLAGNVDTAEAKTRAVEVARATKGVTNVVDRLAVTPPAVATSGVSEAVTDPAITATVKSSFLVDPAVSGLKINVDTDRGVVTLTGAVKTSAEKARAEEIAKNTAGVNAVVNSLTIGKPPKN